MATRKKNKKKTRKQPTTVGGKKRPAQKRAGKAIRVKKSAKKKATRKKTAGKKKGTKKSTSARRTAAGFSRGVGLRSGELAGDLQGLSNVERADSESVDELLEEGNAFEAGVVSGVEEAGNRGEREVHTREVPEDDVPGEYLDEE